MLFSVRSPLRLNMLPGIKLSLSTGWTALVYACSGAGGGAVECSRRLLAAGARVDGAPARGDDVCTLTPLQV